MIVTRPSWSRRVLTAVDAASPASFQPSKATTSVEPPRPQSSRVSVTAPPLRPPGRLSQDRTAPVDLPVVTTSPPASAPLDALPAAVLWDMDGTLVDTEPYWMVAELELVSDWGGVWTHADGLQLVGQ